MADDDEVTFLSFGLDDRVLKALGVLNFSTPTLVQEKGIPLALAGKDLLVRARTGSGKTAAYAIPIVNQLATLATRTSKKKAGPHSLVLVPTRELVDQVHKVFVALTQYCPAIQCLALAGDQSMASQKARLEEHPHVIVTTPGRLVAHLKAKNVVLRESLKMVVVDEADLMFSYGFQDDMQAVLGHLPNICQALLMSATLSPDVEELKKLMLHNPVTLKLEEQRENNTLLEYYINCGAPSEKFLVLYSMLRLNIIAGKALLFVNDVAGCYQLKLFLEQFSITSAVLNSELPENSRLHIVSEFNRGKFDYVIATDESIASADNDEAAEEEEEEEVETKSKKRKAAGKVKAKKDASYGVVRGVDFQGVETVVNFDFPKSSKAYTHRIGRTARAGACGTALTLVSTDDEAALASLINTQTEDGATPVQALPFNMSQVAGFRYRVEDAVRAVTRLNVKESRIKELKQEILNSQKLKSHFDDNPRDLLALKHDAVHSTKVQNHLKNVPSYLVPKSLQENVSEAAKEAEARRLQRRQAHIGKPNKKQRTDPLQTFEVGSKSSDKGLHYDSRGRTLSARNAWKMKHKKGKFAKKSKK